MNDSAKEKNKDSRPNTYIRVHGCRNCKSKFETTATAGDELNVWQMCPKCGGRCPTIDYYPEDGHWSEPVSKEPWIFGVSPIDKTRVYVLSADERDQVCSNKPGQLVDPQNMQRIVACEHACFGVSDEHLQLGMVQQSIEIMKRSLELLESVFNGRPTESDMGPEAQTYRMIEDFLRKVAAA